MMGNARGMKEQRYSFSVDSALLFVLLMCVCVRLCVLLNSRWLNGFLVMLMWEYVGGKGVLFMFAASQCFLQRKQEFM